VETFCGDCHALPRPESFSKDRWHFEVTRGYELYARSGRRDLDLPPLQQALSYYRERAPEEVSFTPTPESEGRKPVKFRQEHLNLPAGSPALPEIGYLRWTRLGDEEEPVLLASDIRHGYLVAIDVKPAGRRPPRVLAQVRNPGRVAVCDLNRDGLTDLVIADLGSYLPSDHDRGRVVLLQRRAGSDGYDARELASGLGRVADVQPMDVDRDGWLELLPLRWQRSCCCIKRHRGRFPGIRWPGNSRGM
jgi:hypothetical protein